MERNKGRRLIHETRANVVGLVDGENKDSSIADLSRSRSFTKDSHEVIDFVIVSSDLNHDFRQECDLILDAAIYRWTYPLTAMSSSLIYSQSRRDRHELLHNIVQLFLPKDALNQLHCCDVALYQKFWTETSKRTPSAPTAYKCQSVPPARECALSSRPATAASLHPALIRSFCRAHRV